MPFLQLAILAFVQGATEFIPVSSSAHLVLVPIIAGWEDQGLAIDVAVHVGALAAVILFFWRDNLSILTGLAALARGRMTSGGRLAVLVAIASVPAVIAGAAVHSLAPAMFRNIEIIAWTTIVFGLLLWWADRAGATNRTHIGIRDALLIGLAQCLAFIPGTSRSGVTMTAGRALGFEAPVAARFALLLSIPTLAGAGALATLELVQAGDVGRLQDAGLAALLAFVTALAALKLLMAWLQRAGFGLFVVYRLILGSGLLFLIYVW